MTPNSILFALRLTEVKRWGIVATAREQSVAEHSFRVQMLAIAIYDYMENGTPHNADDRSAIVSYALMHDMHEIMSGDINTLFKRATEAQYPDSYRATIGAMSKRREGPRDMLNHADAVERAVKGSVVEAIVKIADLLEAILFITDYGTNRERCGQIGGALTLDLHGYIHKCGKEPLLTRYDWNRVSTYVWDVLSWGSSGSTRENDVIQPAAAQHRVDL